jgi:glycosyltransferase involved in cell wall biosynthesis
VRILHLYRPRVPDSRAQSVQVVHTCHALAARGHHVTLLADRARGALATSDPVRALAWYGLDRPPTFDLRVAPTAWPPLAGLWFRAQLSAWRGDVVYARAKRYVASIRADVPVVLEAHELDSALAEERGADPRPMRALEERVFARVAGVVANCGGTLAALEAAHRLPPYRTVIHNATRADRAVARVGAGGPRGPADPHAPEPLVGWTGSARAYKGVATVLASLPRWPEGVSLELVGDTLPDAPSAAAARLRARGPVPYGELPAHLARYHALLLPLDDGLFGRALTSPLKLWDYLATGIPIVAADLPTVREIAGDRPFYWTPGDPDSLAGAVGRALAAGASPPLLRTWDDRAADVEAFLTRVLADRA